MAEKKDVNKYAQFKTLDDFTKTLHEEQYKGIDDAFKAYDKYTHETTQLNMLNNILHPAMDEMYNAFSKQLKTLGADDTKLGGKHKELKKAAVAGLKKFFEKADPTILKDEVIAGIKDDEKLYDVLVEHYDRITGRNPQQKGGAGLIDIIKALGEDKKATVAHALNQLYSIKDKHSGRAVQTLTQKYSEHLFSKYEHAPHKMGAYVRGEMKKRNWEISDPVEFARKGLSEYLAMRHGVVKNDWGEGMKDDTIEQQYGIVHKEPKQSGK